MRLDNFITESSNLDPYEVVVDLYNRSLPYIMELIREFHHINLKTPMLLSGRHSTDTIINKPIRTDRRPKDTSYTAHEFVDGVFHQHFGVYARSASVFVTGKYSSANSYGSAVYGIFPNGTDYNIIWSPNVSDLYSDMLDTSEYRYLGEEFDDVVRMFIDDNDIYNDIRDKLEMSFENDNSMDDFDSEDHYYEAREEYVDGRLEDEVRIAAEEEATRLKGGAEDDFDSYVRYEYKEGNLKDAIMSHNEIMLSGRSYTGVIYNYLPYVLRYMEVHGAKKPNPHLFSTAMVGIDFKKFPSDGTSQNTYRGRLAKTLSGLDISDLKK